MIPYRGDYIEHSDGTINGFKYYAFTSLPLMYEDLYKMDDELSALLIEAHRNIDFLERISNQNIVGEYHAAIEYNYVYYGRWHHKNRSNI